MIRLYARPIVVISGAAAVLLLAAAIGWDYRWQASGRVHVSPRWSIALEQRPIGTPFAEYYYRVQRFSRDGRDTSNLKPVELAPNGGGQTDLCLYRITTPAGRLVLEFVDRMEQSFVDAESFSRVDAVPPGSDRQFVGEFLEASPLTFVPAAPNNRCPHERAA